MTTVPGDPETPSGTRARRTHLVSTIAAVVSAAAAGFGLAVCGGLLAVIFDGVEQWANPPSWLDDTAPFVLIVGALLLAGRVAQDVAGRLATASAVGTGVLVYLSGWAVSRSTEAHGDGLEMGSVLIATVVVTLVMAASSLATALSRRLRPGR